MFGRRHHDSLCPRQLRRYLVPLKICIKVANYIYRFIFVLRVILCKKYLRQLDSCSILPGCQSASGTWLERSKEIRRMSRESSSRRRYSPTVPIFSRGPPTVSGTGKMSPLIFVICQSVYFYLFFYRSFSSLHEMLSVNWKLFIR